MPWYSTKRATTVAKIEGMMACVYHQTAVVRWDDDRVILDSGGFETHTTKTRMNEVSQHYGLGFHVFQTNFEWFVTLPDGSERPFERGMEFPTRLGLARREAEQLVTNMEL